MADMNNTVELNDELATVTDFASQNDEGTAIESAATDVVSTVKEEGSLVKEVGEIMIVGVIIYGFCKLVDFIVDKIKAGFKKLKEKRAEKKAQKAAAQQQAPAQGPVANVTPDGNQEGTAQQ